MIKIVYRIKIKTGTEEEFRTLADKILIPLATSLKGCILFSIFAPYTNKREFIFYEIWESEDAVKSYYEELIKALGPANPSDTFPKKLNNFIEEEEDILHEESEAK